LGIVTENSRSGFTDYSRKEIDAFGNITIVKRPTARKAEWEFIFLTQSNRRIQRALEEARGAPAFFYAGAELAALDLNVYGVVDDFFPALKTGAYTESTLTLTGAS
jgi:hypothetical protein